MPEAQLIPPRCTLLQCRDLTLYFAFFYLLKCPSDICRKWHFRDHEFQNFLRRGGGHALSPPSLERLRPRYIVPVRTRSNSHATPLWCRFIVFVGSCRLSCGNAYFQLFFPLLVNEEFLGSSFFQAFNCRGWKKQVRHRTIYCTYKFVAVVVSFFH